MLVMVMGAEITGAGAFIGGGSVSTAGSSARLRHHLHLHQHG
jgi:hypothetical protein